MVLSEPAVAVSGHHEAALFFTVRAPGMVLNLIPLGISRYVLSAPHRRRQPS